MRSGNPVLGSNAFLDVGSGRVVATDGAMTMNGTVNKTAFLLVLALVGAMFGWSRYTGPESAAALVTPMIGGAIAGFVLALVTVFRKTWAPVTAPLYALAQGVFIGAASVLFESRFPGVVQQAVMATFAVFAVMLVVYRSGWIRVTEKFKLGVVAATGGIVLLYLVNFAMGFFGHSMGIIHGNSGLAIGFSLLVVGIAALNLVLDFDLIESGVRAGAPKFMEWYGAFALTVTLVWLYLEMLRLFTKLQSRD